MGSAGMGWTVFCDLWQEESGQKRHPELIFVYQRVSLTACRSIWLQWKNFLFYLFIISNFFFFFFFFHCLFYFNVVFLFYPCPSLQNDNGRNSNSKSPRWGQKLILPERYLRPLWNAGYNRTPATAVWYKDDRQSDISNLCRANDLCANSNSRHQKQLQARFSTVKPPRSPMAHLTFCFFFLFFFF